MKLESYFNFLAVDDIRIKGTRIGIETVLYDYIYRNKSAEDISESLPSISLAQVYATILYYLNNRPSVEKCLLDWLNFGQEMRERQAKNPPKVVERLKKLKGENSLIATILSWIYANSLTNKSFFVMSKTNSNKICLSFS